MCSVPVILITHVQFNVFLPKVNPLIKVDLKMYFVHLFGNNFEREFLKNFEKHARFS